MAWTLPPLELRLCLGLAFSRRPVCPFHVSNVFQFPTSSMRRLTEMTRKFLPAKKVSFL